MDKNKSRRKSTDSRSKSEYDEDDKKRVKVVKTKKETEDDDDDRKVVSSVKSKKKVVEDDKRAIVSVSTKKTVVVKEKERKSFNLPGQRHEPPEERDGLRIFYESLYRQRPESEMAQIWMMEHGMLEHDEAQQVLDRMRQKKTQFGGGMKLLPTPPSKSGASPNGQSSRKSISAPEAKKSSAKTPEVKKGSKQSDTNGRASDGKKQGTKSVEKAKSSKRKDYDSEEDDYSEEEVIPTKKRRG